MKLTTMPQLSRQTGTSLSDINIVPFVDVMLVLLVIFMITAPILQSGIEVDVPKTKTVKEISESRVVVSVDRAQRIYIGDDPVNIHELGDKVHAQMHNPQTDPIFLRCDKTVPFGSFALVVDTLRQSGISKYKCCYGAARRDSPLEFMSYAPAHPGANSLKKPLVWSVGFHVLLFSSLLVSTLFSHRGDSWGGLGGGDAVSVGLVAKLPGVNLPRPEAVTQSRVVDTSKGLYKTEPQPKPKEIETEVKKIPEFTKEKTPHYITRPSKVLEDTTPPPTNAVPYGGGGAPALPYSQFTVSGANPGWYGVYRAGRRRFSGQIPRVCGRRPQQNQQQLAAVHRGPHGSLGSASDVHVPDLARRNGNEHSDDAIQRQPFGGQLGSACHFEFQPSVRSSLKLFRE